MAKKLPTPIQNGKAVLNRERKLIIIDTTNYCSMILIFLILPIWQINKYLQLKRVKNILKNAEQNFENFTIRKNLYIGSDKVIDFSAYEHLTKIKPNIFRYKDMKIVVYPI